MKTNIQNFNLKNSLYRPCVGIMLFNKDGLVFLGKRNDVTPASWQMPQGGIDHNENPKTAALRELKEETGIETVTKIGVNSKNHEGIGSCFISLRKNIDVCQKSLL